MSITPTETYYQDSTGQWWTLSVNSDGSLETAESSGPSPSPSPTSVVNRSSTITLLNTMEWTKKFMFNRSSALGDFLEPALTSADTVLQTVVGAPFAWPWNRVVTGFITVEGQQDYYLFNWTASTQVELGWMAVDVYGNCQTVSVAGTTGGTYPGFNPTEGDTTSDGTVTWTNLGPIGVTVSPSYSLGWIETVSVQDTTLTTPKWYEIDEEICLSSDSSLARPRNISAQGDDGSGNISFRLMPVPNASYPVAITLQQKPPLFSTVFQTWAPIPDTYSHIYNWGFLSLQWLFADDPRFTIANQKFVTQLLGANQGLDETARNIWLNQWQAIIGQPMVNAIRVQQGSQSRGV